MKQNKALRRAVAFLLAALLLLGVIAPALAAGEAEAAAAFEGDTITIGSAEELLALARRCTLDTWSQNKTVVLMADISLAGVSFPSVPIFGGTFDGAGHTISGLSVDESICPAGLFGIVEKGALIKNLNVSGSIVPAGDGDTMGGIVGINYGRLVGCTFRGAVSGSNTVGGVAGLNEGTGQLINCRFQGVVTGEHYVGGVAGQNFGSLIQCENSGRVNTTEVDVDASISKITLEKLRSTENLPASTDIGGIAGFSTGLIQSCRNTGNVGYEHMGYNVGGIVGRQSGYLDGCVNTGTIRGRKDVGGIAGQMEPQVTLKYSEDTLSSLWDELDTLEELMDHALSDAEHASDAISGSMNGLTASVGTAKDSAVSLSDAMTDWVNGNIDQVNDASARLSWLLTQMEPVMDDISDALEQAETAAGLCSDALDEAVASGQLADDAAEELRLGLEDLQDAAGYGRQAFTHLRRAMTDLKKSLGDETVTKNALKKLVGALSDLSDAVSRIAAAVGNIETALDTFRDQSNWEALQRGVSDLWDALTQISAALAQVSSAVDRIVELGATDENLTLLETAMTALEGAFTDLDNAYTAFSAALDALRESDTGTALEELGAGLGYLSEANGKIGTAQRSIRQIVDNVESAEGFQPAVDDLREGLSLLSEGLAEANTAMEKINRALQALEDSGLLETTGNTLRESLRVIRRALSDAADACDTITQSLETLQTNFKSEEVERAWTQLEHAADNLEWAADAQDGTLDHMATALESGRDAGTHLSAAAEHLSSAGESMEKAITMLCQASEQTAKIIRELAEKPAIRFNPLGSDLTEHGDALDDALSQVLNQVDHLNDTMTSSSNILLTDLRAINRQVGVIIDLLRQASDEAKEKEAANQFEDISDQELSDDRTSGRISNARNAGVVEGDINVAGIVGTLGIEYDFDPEDDLTESGDRSLDFHYQAVAVVTESVNEGTVTAKKNYAGGIVGRTDLGTVNACQGYGSVKSTSGDYVGGIAGLSRAAIRNCYAKCTLSGENYIGGIVGAGEEDSIIQGCYTLVRITGYEQYAGAISGSETGTFTGNYFVSEELAGLGRVSYTGKAEPVSYQTLSAVEGLPKPLRSFTLRFVADGDVLKTVHFDYGASFGGDVYPELPKKEGCFALWDLTELNGLRFDTVVTAVYAPYITALASEERREDGRPVFYAEGKFQSGDRLQAQRLTEASADLQTIAGNPFLNRGLAELWRVRFPEDGQDVHMVRYLRPDGKTQIYVKQNGTWERAAGEEIGRYLAFTVNGTEMEIAAFSLSLVWWVWLLLLLPVLLPLACGIRKRKRKKQREKAGARQD